MISANLISAKKHNLVTGRMQPKLVLVQPWIHQETGTLSLKAPGMEKFELKLPTSSNGYDTVKTTVNFTAHSYSNIL